MVYSGRLQFPNTGGKAPRILESVENYRDAKLMVNMLGAVPLSIERILPRNCNISNYSKYQVLKSMFCYSYQSKNGI